jgi:tetratricopeptide (TPR) repeat protein
MLPEIIQKLPISDVINLIEEARNAELCRDTDSLRKILQIVWEDNNRVPDFAEYEPVIRAELLRLCGFYLTFHGRSRNLTDFHLRAKDLLTNAIDIFQTEGLVDKAAESKINLAFCFWNSGEVEECEAFLSLVENDFNENKLHPVYLQTKINRMMLLCWCERFDEAFAVAKEISPSMPYCSDSRLKIMFNFEAAILFHHNSKHTDAMFYFTEAIRLAKDNNNLHLLALTYNNLSLLYLDLKIFEEAHAFSVKSLDILKKMNHTGWIPHILDSRALIYLGENKSNEALEAVEAALIYFFKGEDYKGLTASLWTKVQCLFRLRRAEDAFIVFSKLEDIASKNIGEVAVRKFAKKLTEEVYVLRNLPLAEESAEFKKSRVARALVEANGTVGAAAKILGLKSHQALSDILNKQFPGLLQELGFSRRARRGTVGKPSRAETVNLDCFVGEREITRLIMPGNNFSFDFNISTEKFETFYFDKHLMRTFGVDSASIVAVVPVSELKAGQNIVVCDKDVFTVAKIEYNDWSGVYFVSDERGEPLPLDEKNVVGEPVGYCLFSRTNEKFIEFSKLER